MSATVDPNTVSGSQAGGLARQAGGALDPAFLRDLAEVWRGFATTDLIYTIIFRNEPRRYTSLATITANMLELLADGRPVCVSGHERDGRAAGSTPEAVGDESRAELENALRQAAARIRELEKALKPFADFNLSGFQGTVLEVVPSFPDNPAPRIEPIWKVHFERAAAALHSGRPE